MWGNEIKHIFIFTDVAHTQCNKEAVGKVARKRPRRDGMLKIFNKMLIASRGLVNWWLFCLILQICVKFVKIMGLFTQKNVTFKLGR